MFKRLFCSTSISISSSKLLQGNKIGMNFSSKKTNPAKRSSSARPGKTMKMREQNSDRQVDLVKQSSTANILGSTSVISTQGVSSNLKTFIEESLVVDSNINRPLTEPKGLANPNLTLVQVEGIPKDWSSAKIRTYFDPKARDIMGVKPIVNKLGLSTGRVVIEFCDADAASKFIRRYDNDFIELPDMSAHLRARLHTLSIRSESLAAKIERDRTVMLYNLPFEATNKEVATVAGYYGELARVDLPQNSRRRNRGYALVTFKDPESAARMLEQFEGLTLHGREVKLKHGDFTFSPDDRPEVLAQRQKKQISHKLRSDVIWEKAETTEIKIKGYFLEKQKHLFEGNLAFD